VRGGGNRTGLKTRSVSNKNSRRRRDRYTRDASRDPWGNKRNLILDDKERDDDGVDTAC
jgi:hypothetical protein